MRPVAKAIWPRQNGVLKRYKPHTIAKPDLEDNLGYYCSYCEVFSSDLEVEHIISQNQDSSLAHSWDNFLLACGRCNGSANKSNRPVDLSNTHFPHKNNTFLSFKYLEGGLVQLNLNLIDQSQQNAERMLTLVGLDKYPGNPKYPKTDLNDSRWKLRRVTWELAKRKLVDFESGRLNNRDIVDFALLRGFFSIWFSVFNNHPEVKELLIYEFIGTDSSCFDPSHGYSPINRNPKNLEDPV